MAFYDWHSTGRKMYVFSSGGQSSSSHGVALLLDRGKMAAQFRSGDRKWKLSDKNEARSDEWHHWTITWHPQTGAQLYMDMDRVASTTTGNDIYISASILVPDRYTLQT